MAKRLHLFFILSFIVSAACGHLATRGEAYPTGSQTGMASWYGKDFHGKPTASGEIYNMYAMTAAHRTLPLGTVLKVTNLENEKNVEVVVNDRGPFVGGRIIDLSYGAAKDLGFIAQGTTKVKLEIKGRDGKYIRYVRVQEQGAGEYVVQVGSFVEEENAKRFYEQLRWKYSDVYITKAAISGKTYHRVRIGRFKNKDTAFKRANALADEGYEAVLMRD